MVVFRTLLLLFFLTTPSWAQFEDGVDRGDVAPPKTENSAGGELSEEARALLEIRPEDNYWEYLKVSAEYAESVHIKGLPYLVELEFANTYKPTPSKIYQSAKEPIRLETLEEYLIYDTNLVIQSLFSIFDILDYDVPIRIYDESSGQILSPDRSVLYDDEYNTELDIYFNSKLVYAYDKRIIPDGGESSNVLVDIGHRLDTLEAGETRVAFEAVGNSEKRDIPAGSTRLAVREMSTSEREAVEALFGVGHGELREPYDWVVAQGLDPSRASNLPSEVRDRVIVYAFLNQASRAESLSQVGIELLELFPDSLKSYTRLFKYEAIKTFDNADSAEAIRASIEKDYPGLKWRLRAIDEGHGHLARAREYYGIYLTRERIKQGKVVIVNENGTETIVDSGDPRLYDQPDEADEAKKKSVSAESHPPTLEDGEQLVPVAADSSESKRRIVWPWIAAVATLVALGCVDKIEFDPIG